jgi:hypothetical protein
MIPPVLSAAGRGMGKAGEGKQFQPSAMALKQHRLAFIRSGKFYPAGVQQPISLLVRIKSSTVIWIAYLTPVGT